MFSQLDNLDPTPTEYTMPNEFSPRYRAQPLKPRDMRRVNRHTASAASRAILWPVDEFALEQHRRRVIFYLDVACLGVFGGIALCIVALILGA